MQLSAGAVGSDLPQGLPLTGRGFICRFNDNDLAERLYAGHLLSLPEFLGGHRRLLSLIGCCCTLDRAGPLTR